MPARIIDGKALGQKYRDDIAARAAKLRAAGRPVRLDAVLVGGDDDAAHQYAESQARTCGALGIDYVLHELPAGAGHDDIAGRVLLLNTKDEVSAIMVHLPLPAEVDAYSVQKLITPEKDVEGVNPANIGNVVYGRSSLAPCTALAVIKMVEHTGTGIQGLRGKIAVVVGASNHVGKPIAVLLMRMDATVVSCNKWTPGLADLTRRADVLVAAAGVPDLITRDMVKPGAVVIDVGVNRVAGPDGKMRTVGDVAYDAVGGFGTHAATAGSAANHAGWISPVPGGVGPMTVAMLLLNVVEAAERAAGVRL
ncbi:MAG: bifunctional 5,10-methylenetetrahydrofolate dehydrogenase/5,10-methenyltetrahydrofolate cyclohydrolase [Phycisphaeraceae bacterium]|nr:bifunctional 5,10-methylenetetrahydrofolate dehydrogenase/5,10-methenyltetrahydrofolate cyclohydrolase [Phycisphaeraceae bacterium]